MCRSCHENRGIFVSREWNINHLNNTICFISLLLIPSQMLSNNPSVYFHGLQNHWNSECIHEIKRHLSLGRKVMTNLDSILKSRDFTLPTRVCIVKVVAFPVVMYRCENWTTEKAEWWRIDTFELRSQLRESFGQEGDQTSQS